MGVHELRWDKRGTEYAGECNFFNTESELSAVKMGRVR